MTRPLTILILALTAALSTPAHATFVPMCMGQHALTIEYQLASQASNDLEHCRAKGDPAVCLSIARHGSSLAHQGLEIIETKLTAGITGRELDSLHIEANGLRRLKTELTQATEELERELAPICFAGLGGDEYSCTYETGQMLRSIVSQVYVIWRHEQSSFRPNSDQSEIVFARACQILADDTGYIRYVDAHKVAVLLEAYLAFLDSQQVPSEQWALAESFMLDMRVPLEL